MREFPSHRIWIVILGMVLLASGCTASLKNATSGQIGCPPSEITISNHTAHFSTSTWTATCRGQTFYCSSATTGSSMVTTGTTSYSTTSSQYQCSPAVAAKTEAPATASATSATPASKPEPAPEVRKDFPTKALGFVFADAPEAGQSACTTQGHEWTASDDTSEKFECSGAGVDVGVPIQSKLLYCGEGLCEIRAFMTLSSGSAGSKQLAKLKKAMTSQYGTPSTERIKIPKECWDTVVECIVDGRASWSLSWEWDDGSVIRARAGTDEKAAIIGLLYQHTRASGGETDSLNTEAF